MVRSCRPARSICCTPPSVRSDCDTIHEERATAACRVACSRCTQWNARAEPESVREANAKARARSSRRSTLPVRARSASEGSWRRPMPTLACPSGSDVRRLRAPQHRRSVTSPARRALPARKWHMDASRSCPPPPHADVNSRTPPARVQSRRVTASRESKIQSPKSEVARALHDPRAVESTRSTSARHFRSVTPSSASTVWAVLPSSRSSPSSRCSLPISFASSCVASSIASATTLR